MNNRIRLKECELQARAKGIITGGITGDDGLAIRLFPSKTWKSAHITYGRFRNGVMRKMDPKTTHRICSIFQCTLPELYGHE